MMDFQVVDGVSLYEELSALSGNKFIPEKQLRQVKALLDKFEADWDLLSRFNSSLCCTFIGAPLHSDTSHDDEYDYDYGYGSR